jgi:DNA-binding XRE family transcriptional regulator
MPLPVAVLLSQARNELQLNQEGLAVRLESSLRTVQRWETGRGTPSPWQLHALADAVRATNPQLAADLDAWAPRPAPAVVAHVPPPAPVPPLPPPPPPIPASVLVDSVVCAAAEAMGQSPQAMRPALLAAFARAHETGLAHAAIVAVLAPPKKGKAGAGG